jgi:protein tyrosine kinase modulator
MPEDFEEAAPESLDWERLLGAVHRRTWYFLIPLFVGWATVWGASWLMPSVYRSGTLILVEQPSVPQSLVPSNVAGNLQGRLDSITQQIMSRTRLLRIIDQFNLYDKDRTRSSPDELVDRMRKDIEIELVRSPDRDQLSSFNIYYSSPDPRVAQEVTSELSNLFISENLDLQQTQAANTTRFLADQLDQAQKDLAAQEEKVREFKDQHLGDLPGQMQSNIEILHGLQAQMSSEQGALTSARERNAYLQSLLEQYRSLQSVARAGTGEPGSLGLPAIDQELDRLRAQLADLRSRYTDKHPDVIKLKDQIARTEHMKQQISAELSASAAQNADNAAPASGDLGARDTGPMLELKSQLKANQIEIANRQSTIKSLEGSIAEYQARLNNAPIREQQLAEITRGYDQSKADYDSLLKRKNESAQAEALAVDQQGEHFLVQDPPNLPTKPYSPNRLKLFATGLVIGLALGGACAAGAEFLDNRLYTENELKQLVPTEILAEIPSIATPEEEARKRHDVWLKVSAAGAVAFSLLIAFAFTYLRG